QEHCCYQGTVQGFPGSWANLCACAGLSGRLWLSDTRSYTLEADSSSPGQHMAFQLRLEPQSCRQGSQPGAEATEPPWPQRGKRAAAEQRFVELVMVVDHTAVSAGQCPHSRGCPSHSHPSDPSPCFLSSRITPAYNAFT
ncbi:ADA15 protein, partial [Spizella passerina]|nr:ADA15 protein [Spizella passerina]